MPYHYEYRGGLLQVCEGVGAVDPPVSEPVEQEAQQSPREENARQTEESFAVVPPVAPNLHTGPLPASYYSAPSPQYFLPPQTS